MSPEDVALLGRAEHKILHEAGHVGRFSELLPLSLRAGSVVEYYRAGNQVGSVVLPSSRSLGSLCVSGATAYCRNVWLPELNGLVARVRQLTGTYAQAALVWSADAWQNGYGLHRDSGDVLVLQLFGEKFWHVRGPKRDNPPALERVVQDGDALFVPEGCWHLAEPRGPTVHVTIGMPRHTT